MRRNVPGADSLTVLAENTDGRDVGRRADGSQVAAQRRAGKQTEVEQLRLNAPAAVHEGGDALHHRQHGRHIGDVVDEGRQPHRRGHQQQIKMQRLVSGCGVEQLRRRVDDAMKMAGIYEFRERAPHNLSGGQKQRVAIAGVVAMRPDCLILDEATAMLDPRGREQVMQTIHHLNKDLGITVVSITHYMEEPRRPTVFW